MYVGKMYSDFKVDLAEIVIEALRPIQDEYNKIYSDTKDSMLKVINHYQKEYQY